MLYVDLTSDLRDDTQGNPAADRSALVERGEAQRGMTILDGRDGALTLDLAHPELRLLSEACKRLLAGDVPRGASVIMVRSGACCYIVSHQASSQGEPVLTISNLFDRGERVTLGLDLARVVIGLLDAAPEQTPHF